MDKKKGRHTPFDEDEGLVYDGSDPEETTSIEGAEDPARAELAEEDQPGDVLVILPETASIEASLAGATEALDPLQTEGVPPMGADHSFFETEPVVPSTVADVGLRTTASAVVTDAIEEALPEEPTDMATTGGLPVTDTILTGPDMGVESGPGALGGEDDVGDITARLEIDGDELFEEPAEQEDLYGEVADLAGAGEGADAGFLEGAEGDGPDRVSSFPRRRRLRALALAACCVIACGVFFWIHGDGFEPVARAVTALTSRLRPSRETPPPVPVVPAGVASADVRPLNSGKEDPLGTEGPVGVAGVTPDAVGGVGVEEKPSPEVAAESVFRTLVKRSLVWGMKAESGRP